MRLRNKVRIDTSAAPAAPARERCESCGLEHPCYNITAVGGDGLPTQKLCSFCFNSWMAQDLSVPMPDPVEFPPLVLKDGAGRTHTFYFDLKLEDTGIFIVAFEWVNDGVGGHQFAVFDKFDVSSRDIHNKLVYKIRRSLRIQYLDRHKLALRGDAVNGMFVDVNPESGEAEPGVMVDGRFMSWLDFAACFREWAGHQFRIECADIAEEMSVEAQWAPSPLSPEGTVEHPEGHKEETPAHMEFPHNGFVH